MNLALPVAATAQRQQMRRRCSGCSPPTSVWCESCSACSQFPCRKQSFAETGWGQIKCKEDSTKQDRVRRGKGPGCRTHWMLLGMSRGHPMIHARVSRLRAVAATGSHGKAQGAVGRRWRRKELAKKATRNDTKWRFCSTANPSVALQQQQRALTKHRTGQTRLRDDGARWISYINVAMYKIPETCLRVVSTMNGRVWPISIAEPTAESVHDGGMGVCARI
jgi:hypothetical protein